MGTVSLLIFYLFIAASGVFAAYCARLSFKKSMNHIVEKQHFSAFTFYALYLLAAVISAIIMTVTLAECLLLLTGQALSINAYSVLITSITLLTALGSIIVTYKAIISAAKSEK